MAGEVGVEAGVAAGVGFATCAGRDNKKWIGLSAMTAYKAMIEFAHLNKRLGLDGINTFGFATNTHDKVWCLDRWEGERRAARSDAFGQDGGCAFSMRGESPVPRANWRRGINCDIVGTFLTPRCRLAPDEPRFNFRFHSTIHPLVQKNTSQFSSSPDTGCSPLLASSSQPHDRRPRPFTSPRLRFVQALRRIHPDAVRRAQARNQALGRFG